MFGMRMSISTTSGRSSAVSRIASFPSAASPTTSMSACESRITRKPPRTSAWSSASRTRITCSRRRRGAGHGRNSRLAHAGRSRSRRRRAQRARASRSRRVRRPVPTRSPTPGARRSRSRGRARRASGGRRPPPAPSPRACGRSSAPPGRFGTRRARCRPASADGVAFDLEVDVEPRGAPCSDERLELAETRLWPESVGRRRPRGAPRACRRISVSACRPASSTTSSASRARAGSSSTRNRAAPVCAIITPIEWPTTSWSSRAIRARSSAIARARARRARARGRPPALEVGGALLARAQRHTGDVRRAGEDREEADVRNVERARVVRQERRARGPPPAMPTSAERVLFSIVPATQNARITGGEHRRRLGRLLGEPGSSASEPRTTSTEALGQRCREQERKRPQRREAVDDERRALGRPSEDGDLGDEEQHDDEDVDGVSLEAPADPRAERYSPPVRIASVVGLTRLRRWSETARREIARTEARFATGGRRHRAGGLLRSLAASQAAARQRAKGTGVMKPTSVIIATAAGAVALAGSVAALGGTRDTVHQVAPGQSIQRAIDAARARRHHRRRAGRRIART